MSEDTSSDKEMILFSTEDIDFTLNNEGTVTQWVQTLIQKEAHFLRHIHYIFCSDAFLHRINLEYLQHDTYTDIITFPYALSPFVESDIFISIERVRENATTYGVPFRQELLRVMAHGVLHLCGYADKTNADQQLMRAKEDAAIALFEQIR